MNKDPIIMNLVDEILNICNPIKIILYNVKFNIIKEMTSFKLCVIVSDDTAIDELESKLYLELDCENPFDVLLYTLSEWEHYNFDETSFAGKIAKTGVVLYEL